MKCERCYISNEIFESIISNAIGFIQFGNLSKKLWLIYFSLSGSQQSDSWVFFSFLKGILVISHPIDTYKNGINPIFNQNTLFSSIFSQEEEDGFQLGI